MADARCIITLPYYRSHTLVIRGAAPPLAWLTSSISLTVLEAAGRGAPPLFLSALSPTVPAAGPRERACLSVAAGCRHFPLKMSFWWRWKAPVMASRRSWICQVGWA